MDTFRFANPDILYLLLLVPVLILIWAAGNRRRRLARGSLWRPRACEKAYSRLFAGTYDCEVLHEADGYLFLHC